MNSGQRDDHFHRHHADSRFMQLVYGRVAVGAYRVAVGGLHDIVLSELYDFIHDGIYIVRADSDETGLALLFQHFLGFDRLVRYRIRRVSGVQMPDVDMICPQRLETLVHVLDHIGFGQSIGFAGQNNFVSPALESSPGDLFAFAFFVHAGSVEVVDAQICGTNEDRGIGNKADTATDAGSLSARSCPVSDSPTPAGAWPKASG